MVGFASSAFAQANVDDLIEALREDPENAAALVEAAVENAPDQAGSIVNQALAAFPELAEEIVAGAIKGLGDPDEEDLASFLSSIVNAHPGLAADIVAGAVQAAPQLENVIFTSVRDSLRKRGFRLVGETDASPVPGSDANNDYFQPELRVISPSRN